MSTLFISSRVVASHRSLLAISLLLYAAAAAVSGQSATRVPAKYLVTSPSNCLTSIDCATNSFCSRELPYSSRYPSFKCQLKRPSGASCISPRLGSECRRGLFCSNVNRVCTPQRTSGAMCSRREPRQCRGSPIRQICRASDGRCGPPPLGGTEGAPCRQFLDCANTAFYCIRTEGKCARRLPPAARCRSRFLRQCQGFCAPLSNDIVSGTCLPRGNDGAACRMNEHCDDSDLVVGIGAQTGRLNRRLCNIPRGAQGICLRDSLHLKRVGAPCTPTSDRCDARRGLSCRRRPGGQLSRKDFVCVQSASVEDVRTTRFCSPNTPFSMCISRNGLPSQCRRERLDNLSNRFDGLFACMRALEVLPRGAVCGHVEYAVCGPKASCQSVPGVKRKFLSNVPVKACVEIRRLGQRCDSKFFVKCANGLTCTNGICVRGNDPPSTTFTHAYVSTECTNLPCVPGLVCKKPSSLPFSSPICQFPLKVAKPGQLCYNTANSRRTCPKGYACSKNAQGRGLLRCFKPFGVGGVCTSDARCLAGLKCGPVSVTPPFVKRCYNPKRLISLGASCKKNSGPAAARCAVANVTDIYGVETTVESRCLLTTGSFKCQRPALLYEQCSKASNLACIGGNICGPLGYCVARV